jgi:hypothetical protein
MMNNRMSAEERKALKAEVYESIKKLAEQDSDMGMPDHLVSTATLIERYAFEAGRINRKDAELNKAEYKKALRSRLQSTLRLLDDEQTEENPMGTLFYLLGI